jgi:quercetin dioxygenase-like cupin family protein
MNEHILKNIDFATLLEMDKLVEYQPGQVVSKTLVQNKAVSITLFAFDKDEEISSHDSNGDAIVYVLDGEGRITIGDTDYNVAKGNTIVMPAKVPHAVMATQPFKMLLVVVF